MLDIIVLSIKVSLTALLFSTIFSLLISPVLAFCRFRGRDAIITIINTLMAMPTVVVGILVYTFLSKKGIFGGLSLLYTPYAMVIGQSILATPIITGIMVGALAKTDPRIQREAKALGADNLQTIFVVLKETLPAMVAAVVAGFSRIFSEVGISAMVGGNIAGYTRNIPTAILLETAKGRFEMGLILGGVLLSVAFFLNLIFYSLTKRWSE
jgi:tungstate transport system permease protein